MARLTILPGRLAAPVARVEQNRVADARRGTAHSRGYDAWWDRESRAFRKANPLCQYCELNGKVAAAALTDHLYPQRQYANVFRVRHWWVASCDTCHSGFKQALELQGKPALDDLARRLGRPVHP